MDNIGRYLDFVENRHSIWQQRQMDAFWLVPDRILASRKFTNVFRVLDPGTQFILTDLVPGVSLSPLQVLARIFLYRHTGVISAWEFFYNIMGRYVRIEDIESSTFEQIFSAYRGIGNKVFTGAYMVFPQSHEKGTDKVASIADLTLRMVYNVAERFVESEDPREQFDLLKGLPGVGDFMAMQVLTDWGYTYGDDRENDFVVAGPGSRRGAKDLFPHLKPEQAIITAKSLIEMELEDTYLQLPDGGVRYPSLMDVQNTFCEWSKYLRYQKKSEHPIYRPAHPGKQPEPVFPKHWKGQDK